MATSVSADSMNFAGGMSSPGIAFNIEVAECLVGATFSVPERVRRRLEQSPETKPPASLEEIEARLKEADSRRQQFHVWLANKARPKRKLDQTSSPVAKELAERLEARLCAAEQKRLEMLAQEQMRLAKLNESRVAAKTEAQLRAEREREELGSKVEFRVQQAEINRLALVEAEKQRRAAANERIAQSIMQRTSLEDKDRERAEALRVAIGQRIAAAEEKRACLLEAEKNRAQAIVMQARKVAEAVLREREVQVMSKKEKLEARMLRAKHQRAEYLRQKGGCRGACHNHGLKMKKSGEILCTMLTRCWKRFKTSRKTTYVLAKEFVDLGINQLSVPSLNFEELVKLFGDGKCNTDALLARLERRLMLSEPSGVANIDSLHKRLCQSAGRRGKPKEAPPKEKMERYPTRVFLCAYMIVGQPDVIFNGIGEREIALAEAAAKLVLEFEVLLSMVIEGPSPSPASPRSPGSVDGQTKSFAAQLLSFDNAWHSYYCRFVAWKVKDARLLEEDLIRKACQMEVSMLQKCKVDPRVSSALNHDTEAIREQVLGDQKKLSGNIFRLTGKGGLERMEAALSAVREKFAQAKANGVPLPSPFAFTSPDDLKTVPETASSSVRVKPKAARPLFTSPAAASSSGPELTGVDLGPNSGVSNEQIVNEMLHDGSLKVSDGASSYVASIRSQLEDTYKRAYWDVIEEGLLAEVAEYSRVVSLVGEIRDDLEKIAPESWKQGLRESLDLELLSQVLESGINDFEHLRRLLDYTLDVILRLGAPSRDTDSKSARQTLVEDLSKATLEGNTKVSFGRAVVKGMRFVFEQLQVLKQDISNARLQSFSQILGSSAGVDYMQKAFGERYGLTPAMPDEQLREKLPRAVSWLSGSRVTLAAQRGEVEAVLCSLNRVHVTEAAPPTFPMCTGGRVVVSGPSSSKQKPPAAGPSSEEQRMGSLSWDSTDALVRLGLLELISSPEAASEKDLPETMTLNVARLRDCQNDFQAVVVMATGLLLLRQELMAKVPASKMEAVVSEAHKELSVLLSGPEVSVTYIGSMLAKVCAKSCSEQYPDMVACAEFMTRVMGRSLTPGDVVLGRVTAAVRSSLRAVLVVGNGGEGVGAAEAVLKRIGGGMLVEAVVGLARKLDKISNVTVQVHGAWYKRMV